MPDEKAPSSGAFLTVSLMYFCSGKPMHLSSGVDRLSVESEMTGKPSNVRSKPNGRIKGTTTIYRTHEGDFDIN